MTTNWGIITGTEVLPKEQRVQATHQTPELRVLHYEDKPLKLVALKASRI